MAKTYLSSDLIDSIKARVSVPTNQSTFTDTDFLRFANEEISLNLVPSILSLHEDHLLYTETQALSSTTTQYTIPSRAIGNKLKDLQYLDTNGNHFEMTRISVGDLPHYQGAFIQNRAYAYYIQYNRVHLLPPIQTDASGSLEFFYFIGPNELVDDDRAAIITDINRTTGEISVDKIPDNFSINIEYDMYMAKSPHRHLMIDLTATSVNSTTKVITFSTDDIPEQLEVGDHIAQAGECIIPQVPDDLHVLLAQYVAERILESIGDTEGLQNARTKTQQMEFKAGNIIDNRVDEAPQKLVNRRGPLRSGLHSRRYRRRS